MIDQSTPLAARLAQAEIIAPLGYGRGFPVLLPWGNAIVDRLIALFRDCLSTAAIGSWSEWEPELLVPEDRYEREVGGTGGFNNVFRVELNGQRWVLRPDAAVDGLRQALQAAQLTRTGSAFCAYAAHRRLGGACTPLWRDQAIWPLMQLDVVTPGDSRATVSETIIAGLNRFFSRMGLPTKTVDMGPWKDYARRRLDWVLATHQHVPTVLAMAYTVGTHYRAISGIPYDWEGFDVGLTAKSLAAVVELTGHNDRLVLPRAVAPVEVVVASPGAARAPEGCQRLRVAHVDSHAKHALRRWERRGVPVLLQFDIHDRARQRVGNRAWEPWDPDSSLDSLVDQAFTPLHGEPTSLPINSDIHFEVLCESCAVAHALHAPVEPQVDQLCRRCGEAGVLRLIADTKQIY